MAPKIKTLNHGRETYAVYYGDGFVLKRPLPLFSDEACDKWLEKQHRTKETIDAIRAIGNPTYNVPAMHFVNDDEYQILEERAPGVPLTREVYRSLTRRQRYEIINSIAGFLVDMNESKPVMQMQSHCMTSEFKSERLGRFIDTKMSNWFNKNDVRYVARIYEEICEFKYDTCQAWSHCDINSGNVFYDPKSSRISFIDFAEANYNFIYRDIFGPLQLELDICKGVYDAYTHLHNKSLFPVLSPRSEKLRELMKYRVITVHLKRFLKAAEDLRANPANEKSINNNAQKIEFMHEQMQAIQAADRMFITNR